MAPDRENTGRELAQREIEQLVRQQWGKLLATLIAQLGDFQLAEDSLQDGLESALYHWQRNGLPRSPAAWLLQTARRKAIDRLRRQANFSSKQADYQLLLELDRQDMQDELANEGAQEIPDERLRLIFTCCHPALDEKSRTALTLRTLGGLTTADIASAYLDSVEAMAQRLVRAKRKIKNAAIPYQVPPPDQWGGRLETVLEVLYLIFNEGYFSSRGESQIRVDLSGEAIRLARVLLKLRPGEAEAEGLLALMLLHDGRRLARLNSAGEMVALAEHDRTLWLAEPMAEGLALLDRALARQQAGPYQIQAAISALHAQAASHEETDWCQIVLLYDQLYLLQPTPVVRLNQCVAQSFAQSPAAALKLMAALEDQLQDYQPYFASKADFLARTGDRKNAEVAYLRAIELSDEPQTRSFLERKLGVMLRG